MLCVYCTVACTIVLDHMHAVQELLAAYSFELEICCDICVCACYSRDLHPFICFNSFIICCVHYLGIYTVFYVSDF